jgi:hypothetical protein
MGLRILIISGVLAAATVAVAHDIHPRIEGRVQNNDVCWDPDVEFPVPCDDDDD